MARMTDTAKGYRALMGVAVEIDVVGLTNRGEGETVRGLVWAPAPLDDLTTTSKWLRGRHGMERAAERESVWVLATGGRIFRAEINVRTLCGFGVQSKAGSLTPLRHGLTDAEILAPAAPSAEPLPIGAAA